MNTGKTLFAQLMDFLPWTTFARYVARYSGDKGVGNSHQSQWRYLQNWIGSHALANPQRGQGRVDDGRPARI